MRQINLNTMVGLIVAFSAIACAEEASLNGIVKDREKSSPIKGVNIKLGATVAGITGDDGKYIVRKLRRGTKVNVTYTKEGYGAKTESVVLREDPTQNDVALFRNTTDTAYWSSWSDNLRKDVQSRGLDSQSQSKEYARQWKDIEDAGLTESVKTAAAQELILNFPTQSDVPATLRASADSWIFRKDLPKHFFVKLVEGDVSKDGKTIALGEAGTQWVVKNPNMLQGFKGQHVAVSGNIATDNKSIDVTSITADNKDKI